MNKQETKKRIEKLRKIISAHRYSYHVLDKQDISDAAWDSLKHELFLLEQQYPDLITTDSPTQRVGGKALDKFKKISHRTPMLSIEDVFSFDELESWEKYLLKLSKTKKLEYFSELKIDGFAVSLLYKNGVLEYGATRGDGKIGEDVTQNLKTIESIPLKLQVHKKSKYSKKLEQLIEKGTIEIRGEVYMKKKAFEEFNKKREKEGKETYSNPRNLAAGSIRQLDPKLAAKRPLEFIAYDMVTEFGQSFHDQEHEAMNVLGFKTDSTALVCKDIKEVDAYYKRIEKKRDSLPFQADGVVVSLNDNKGFLKLGVAGKSPRAIRALKFAGKQATTRIIDIEPQIGRTGAITPVAHLEPINFGGVRVTRATLHNSEEIKRLGVKIGDTVVVERAGDVIPAVVKVLKELRTGKEKSYNFPSHCPVCDSKLYRPEKEKVWRCPSSFCRAQKERALYHFVSKKAFNIEGLGPKIIDQLLEVGVISQASDIFKLEEGDLVGLERFAEVSASNLVKSIKEKKEISLSRFIYSLGIRHVGEETAIDLAKKYNNLRAIKSATVEELESIADIGNVVAESVYSWFHKKQNQELLDKFIDAGVIIKEDKRVTSSKLKGKIFVLTGHLNSTTRDEAKNLIRNGGGDISESVSKKTSYLVVGKEPGSKVEKARKLGVKLIEEKKFIELIKL